MDLKQLIAEAVITDTLQETSNELYSIKKSIMEQLITEGVDDPGILKVVFLAGGMGSGKSFVAASLFGFNEKLPTSFSTAGLKAVNSDRAFEKSLKQNGIDSNDLAKIEADDPDLWAKVITDPDSIRNQAKQLSVKQKSFYEAGRLGMIIDGTGHDYDKIKNWKRSAEKLGYDSYMIFVNTSLEVAIKRNQQRERTLPDTLVRSNWKHVQENLGRFKGLFGGNFDIIDNTVKKPISSKVQAAVNKFLNKKIQNPIGVKWIATAKALKNANLIKK